MNDVLYLLAGCGLLFFGANWLVTGAVTIASAFGVPRSVVGLTLVAVGTSAPEVFVNVIAASQGETGIALSNVSGSNLTNICIGFGLCAVTVGLTVKWRAFRTDFIIMILAAVTVLGFLAMNLNAPELSTWALVPFIGLLLYYGLSLFRRTKGGEKEEKQETSLGRLLFSAGQFLAGIVALYFGGDFILEGAVNIAETLGMKKSLIGLTIVAAGTSIPDAVASFVAAKRGEHDIAVGNLVGSNISNIVVVLSATLIASQNNLASMGDKLITIDYLMVLVVSLLMTLLAVFLGRINRTWGIVLLLLYAGYMSLRIYLELV